eukprot:jgi/Chlat1/1654/Chrsp127S01900
MAQLPLRVLLVDNYDSYTFNLYHLLAAANHGVTPIVIKNDELTWEELRPQLVGQRAYDCVVISPGPGTPETPVDVGVCVPILRECEELPVLGVCLGHQALGFVHGARIVHAPEPVHGRRSEVEHSSHELFKHVPSGRDAGFEVVRYHSLALDVESLPDCLVATAWTVSTEGESNAERAKSVVMGVSHVFRPHHGVQFHPESVASSYGDTIAVNFLRLVEQHWQSKCESYGATVHAGMCSTSGSHEPMLHSQSGTQLLWRRLPGALAAVGDTDTLFMQLYGHSAQGSDTFWLDSASTEEGRARFSFMGGRGGSLWRRYMHRLTPGMQTGTLYVEHADGTLEEHTDTSFLEHLDKDLADQHCVTGADLADQHCVTGVRSLPFNFCGGYVGYLGYEMKAECEAPVSACQHDSPTPDAGFFFADRFLAIDHLTKDIYILALIPTGDPDKYALDWIDSIVDEVLQGRVDYLTSRRTTEGVDSMPPFKLKKSKQEYLADIQICQELINDGETYEVCLTTAMQRKPAPALPLELYRTLRRVNPAPYAAWLQFNDALSICCSSPERFLKLGSDGVLEAKPIKGTRPRAVTSEEDEAMRVRLQRSLKDRAENLMIVDLLRHDLGRVCEGGSVHVPALMAVESYATVHQLVSTIHGRKREDVSPVECVRAAFPAGSMTGAPKSRTMTIIDAVEGSSRGVYSGAIGFFSVSGTFDLNVVIRTAVVFNNEVTIGAGGAIVALSSPEEEFSEMLVKGGALLRAVGECEADNTPAAIDIGEEESRTRAAPARQMDADIADALGVISKENSQKKSASASRPRHVSCRAGNSVVAYLLTTLEVLSFDGVHAHAEFWPLLSPPLVSSLLVQSVLRHLYVGIKNQLAIHLYI